VTHLHPAHGTVLDLAVHLEQLVVLHHIIDYLGLLYGATSTSPGGGRTFSSSGDIAGLVDAKMEARG
jgi:hypothetical protein